MFEEARSQKEAPIRRITRFALLPIAATLLLHQLLGEPAGYPAVPVAPFAVAPYDHVGPLTIAGFEDFGAVGLLVVQYSLLTLLLAHFHGGLAAVPAAATAGLGLLIGGGASNAVETLVRGATLDYLWVTLGANRLLVANVADAALAGGVVLLFASILPIYWERQPL